MVPMFSPLADAELGQQNIDVNFTSATDPTTANEINLLGDPSQIQNNLETWIVDPTFPEGVYSGAIFPETLMELEVSIKAGQNRGFETFKGNSFEIMPDKDINQFSDVAWEDYYNEPWASCFNHVDNENGYWGGSPGFASWALAPTSGGPSQDMDGDNDVHESLLTADPDCENIPLELGPYSSNQWEDYDNSFDDPYGRDDYGISGSWHYDNPNWRSMDRIFNSDIQHWGEDSYHNFVAVGATAKFSQDQIMSGTSEFWVRSPLGGDYDSDNSFLAIYEVSDVTKTSFTVSPNTVSRNSTYSDKWWEATSGDTLDYAVTPIVAGGTPVYQSRLGAQDVILTDYSEMCYYWYDNGTAGAMWDNSPDLDSNGIPENPDPETARPDPFNGEHDFVRGNGGSTADYYIQLDGDLQTWATGDHSSLPDASSSFDNRGWSVDGYPYGASAAEGTSKHGCDREDWHHFESGGAPAMVGGLDRGFASYIPDNAWPANHYAVRPADSYQTQTNPDPKNPGYERTYHRVNTFMYPNQAYLFIWYLELEAGCSDMTGPTIGGTNCPYFYFTEEDINTFKTDNHIGSYILTGEYNYDNPDTNGDGIADFLRKPQNLDLDGDNFPLDAGMSFIFTQGQSNDMAGYTLNADNTTMLMFKELDESVKHEAGNDGLFYTTDDELDYISIYFPFVNHDQKDLTIEYIAWAFQEKPGGGFIYKPWFNSTSRDTGETQHGYSGGYGTYNDMGGTDTSIFTAGSPCGVDTKQWDDTDAVGIDLGWNDTGGERCYDSAEYNFYYSGFDYYGNGKNVYNSNPCCGSYTGSSFAKVPLQPRAGALNDVTQNGDAFRQQYRDYFLHSTSLVPENGTTHILYMFKLGGHFHWEANLENNRVFGNWKLPMVDMDAISVYDSPFFISDKDENKDGFTDGVQDNSTEITILISKSQRQSEVSLELPIWPVGGPGSGSGGCAGEDMTQPSFEFLCAMGLSAKGYGAGNRELNTRMPIYDLGACELFDLYGDYTTEDWYTNLIAGYGIVEQCASITSKAPEGFVYPRRIQMPTSGFIHYDEVWSNTGYRVDAYESQELLAYGLGSSSPYTSTAFSYFTDSYYSRGGHDTIGTSCGIAPGIGAMTLGGTSWHQIKMSYAGYPKSGTGYEHLNYFENSGTIPRDNCFSSSGHTPRLVFPETNARGASYIQPMNQATINAEPFASVSITNGRWAQSVHTGGDSYSILDPVFHNRVVTKSSYTITIIAHSEDVYGDIAEIHGETPLEETTVLDQVSTFAYDLYQDIGNYWQAGITRTQGCLEQLTSCLWNMLLAIKEGIIEALEYAYDGTLAMYGTVMTKLGEFKEQIVGFGRIVSEVALSMVGVITTLVTEIGDSLDEIGQALLILITMLIAYGLYYMIVKHGTIIIMALEDV